MKTLKELLIEFDACSPAIEWAGDKNIEEFVKECHKGELLLWLAKKLELPERKLITCNTAYWSFASSFLSVEPFGTIHKENQLKTANIVRERLGKDIINKVNELLNN